MRHKTFTHIYIIEHRQIDIRFLLFHYFQFGFPSLSSVFLCPHRNGEFKKVCSRPVSSRPEGRSKSSQVSNTILERPRKYLSMTRHLWRACLQEALCRRRRKLSRFVELFALLFFFFWIFGLTGNWRSILLSQGRCMKFTFSCRGPTSTVCSYLCINLQHSHTRVKYREVTHPQKPRVRQVELCMLIRLNGLRRWHKNRLCREGMLGKEHVSSEQQGHIATGYLLTWKMQGPVEPCHCSQAEPVRQMMRQPKASWLLNG